MKSFHIFIRLLVLIGGTRALTLLLHPSLRRRWTWFLLPLDGVLLYRTHQHLVAHGVHSMLMDPVVRVYYFMNVAFALDLLLQLAARGISAWRPTWRRRWVAVSLWTGLGLFLVSGLVEAYSAPRVTTVDVTLPGLPPSMEGFRILQGSDIHSGPLTTRGMLRRSRAVAESTHPDLILLTGDYVDTSASELADFEAEFSNWKAPQGIYAVLGNHDGYREPESIGVRLREMGIHLLADEAVQIREGDGSFWLLGLDDGLSGHHQWRRTPAWKPEPPFEGPAILITHRPEGWMQARRLGVPLTLAGHTHGGQINPIPGLPTAEWMKGPWIAGNYDDKKGHRMWVSRGLGVTGLPFRFRAKPEWVVVVLHRGN